MKDTDQGMHNRRLDGLALVGLAFFVFMLLNVFKDQGWVKLGNDQPVPIQAAMASQPDQIAVKGVGGQDENQIKAVLPGAIDVNAFSAPYDHFAVTQGLHGYDYGHMAIDISAGKGAPILSPINGWVANLYVDEWGNPSLVLENDRYLVEMLHGIYTVKTGDPVTLGQSIGLESNQGNTADMWGYSCRGRDCGYHTHINVFDKTLGANVNPLDLFPVQ